jgi:hypothetical protein
MFRGWPAEALEFYEGLEANNSKALYRSMRLEPLYRIRFTYSGPDRSQQETRQKRLPETLRTTRRQETCLRLAQEVMATPRNTRSSDTRACKGLND